MLDNTAHSKLRRLRHAFAVARNVIDGTDGSPISAARLLAEAVHGAAEAIAAACAKDVMGEKVRAAAPMLVTARMAAPEAFEEARGLLADIGAPPILDDLPAAWSMPPEDLLGADYFGMASEIGRVIGATAREIDDGKAAAEEQEGEEEVDVGKVVADALAQVGITATSGQIVVVVAAVLDALGYVVEPEDDVVSLDDGAPHPTPVMMVTGIPPGVMRYPRTPWMLDFAPVAAAQHVDTVPDDVRVHYGAALKAMLSAMDMHPEAVVHAVFVENMDNLPNAVPLSPPDARRLGIAWANFKDEASWGPAPNRPDAIWYPLVRTPVIVPATAGVVGPF